MKHYFFLFLITPFQSFLNLSINTYYTLLVKTAKPIGPKFCVRESLWMIEFSKISFKQNSISENFENSLIFF